MSTPNTIADLFVQILNIDRTKVSIDNGTITVTQNGQSISLPTQGNTTIRSSISRF